MIALDTETTGKDFHHGSIPFFVTIYDKERGPLYWEWFVDPLTRQPIIPDGDLDEINREIDEADELVLHNAKFDCSALVALGLPPLPWKKTHDTLTASHLLNTVTAHDLTSLGIQYLAKNIEKYEKKLEKTVKEARRATKRKEFIEAHGKWAIADFGREDMPSCPKSKSKKAGKGDDRDAAWKLDMWLPRAVAKATRKDPLHPWWTALSDYSTIDSEVTWWLWNHPTRGLKHKLETRKLWRIYEESIKTVGVTWRVEGRGATGSRERLEKAREEYQREREVRVTRCEDLAAKLDYQLDMPKSGNNAKLLDFVFNKLKLPVVSRSEETGEPSLNKIALTHYLATLPEKSRQRAFIDSLSDKRKIDMALGYMSNYRRFFCRLPDDDEGRWFVLYPNMNPTGTNTLRFSHSNPNQANISKKEGFNLRYFFGPRPGREWWALDGKNMELRLPAYESGEEAFIDLFERPDEPPYFGSNHLLIAHLLWPDKFEECIRDGTQTSANDGFKRKYKDTLYDAVKRGNFAIQYEAGDKTADAAYGIPGARAMIKKRFAKQEALSQKWKRHADRFGYVETIPDRSVDPDRGFPIVCSRSESGRIKPTLPLSYHIQGSVGWWMRKAMVRCDGQLEEWNRSVARTGLDPYDHGYFMILQVHDELVFDFPRRACPLKDPKRSNLGRIYTIQKLMEKGGDDFGIPTPTSIEFHPDNYSAGIAI